MMGRIGLTLGVAAGLGLTLSGCELGQKQWSQTGYRGAGLQQISDVSRVSAKSTVPAPPYPLEPAMRQGQRAKEAYQNVQVLGDVSTEEFNHLMASMVTWIAPGDAPTQGCNYCHNPENMASDEKYTKVVARRMIQMTRGLNANWTSHVQNVGVTCWTCHRGNAVPVNRWSLDPNPDGSSMTIRGNKHGQNTPAMSVGYASLPNDPFSDYLNGHANIRVASSSAYPSPDHQVSIKDAEKTYGLMMHQSQALGVNCTYCHNSQSFRAWNLSRAQRNTAWYGIRMVRDINQTYIGSLQNVFPANRKGPAGDVYKANCLTCHQGQAKPMGGVPMLKDYPYLGWHDTPVGGNATVAAFHAPGAMTQAPTPTTIPAGAGVTATTVGGLPQLDVYFDTGKAAVSPDFAQRNAALVAALKAAPTAKAVVSGYNDPTGNAAANAALAKHRAQAVAAALKDAGVAEDRIVLEKPAETTQGAGNDAGARRVEVNVRQ